MKKKKSSKTCGTGNIMLISLPTRNKSYFRIRTRTYQIGLYHCDSSPIRDISVLNLLIATLCTLFFFQFFFSLSKVQVVQWQGTTISKNCIALTMLFPLNAIPGMYLIIAFPRLQTVIPLQRNTPVRITKSVIVKGAVSVPRISSPMH